MAKTRAFRSTLSILGWNLGLLVAGLVAVELAFGGWLDAVGSPALWRLSIYRDVDWRLSAEGKYSRSGPVVYRRDRFGLRGAYGTPADITLLVLGGSTTDERFVSEGETWTDVLSDCLRREGRSEMVANAGVAGQSSRGHLRNFDLWLPFVEGLRPRRVLYYVGVNERALEGREAEDDVTAYNETGRPLWLERMRQNSALVALAATVRGNLQAWRVGFHPAGGGSQGTDTVDAGWHVAAAAIALDSDAYRARLATTRAHMATDLDAYAGRLRALVARTRAFGAEPVFVTQSEASWRLVGGSVRGDLDAHFRMAAINATTLAVCRESGAACIDLAGQLAFGDGDFYDSVHTTPAGSRKIGLFVCRALGDLDKGLVPAH